MIRGVPVEIAGGEADEKRVVVCDLLHDSVGVLLKVCVCVCMSDLGKDWHGGGGSGQSLIRPVSRVWILGR